MSATLVLPPIKSRLIEAGGPPVLFCPLLRVGPGVVPVGAPDPTSFKCKDYYTDVAWSYARNEGCTVWGFSWKPGILPKGLKTHLVALWEPGNASDKRKQQMLNAVQILYALEARMKFPHTKCTINTVKGEHDNKPALALIMEHDKAWFASPVLVSAFTLVTRAALGFPTSLTLSEEAVHTFLTKGGKPAKPDDFPGGTRDHFMLNNERVRARLEAFWNGNTAWVPQFPSAASYAHNGGIMGWWNKSMLA